MICIMYFHENVYVYQVYICKTISILYMTLSWQLCDNCIGTGRFILVMKFTTYRIIGILFYEHSLYTIVALFKQWREDSKKKTHYFDNAIKRMIHRELYTEHMYASTKNAKMENLRKGGEKKSCSLWHIFSTIQTSS